MSRESGSIRSFPRKQRNVDSFPILEEDEAGSDDEGLPMMPVFSVDEEKGIPKEARSVDNKKRRIEQEIEGDFDREFYRDSAGLPSLQNKPLLPQQVDLGDPDSSLDESTDESEQTIEETPEVEPAKPGKVRSWIRRFTTHASQPPKLGQDSSEGTEMDSLDPLHGTMKSKFFHFGAPKERPVDEEMGHYDEAKGIVETHVPLENLRSVSSEMSLDRGVLRDTDSNEYFMAPLLDDYDEMAPHEPAEQQRYKKGIFSNIMRLYNSSLSNVASAQDGDKDEMSRAKKWKRLSLLNRSSSSSINEVLSTDDKKLLHKREVSGSSLASIFGSRESSSQAEKVDLPQFEHRDKKLKDILKLKKKRKRETAARITVHIADVLQRQKFILTLCKAFMMYGAPNHRLEEYLSAASRVLEIDSSFIYLPGVMIVSFGDPSTRTSEVKLVRVSQGLNLGKLDEAHELYKSVVHDRIGVEEASARLEELLQRPNYFNTWWSILLYGISSCSVISWAFGGSWLDIPPTFVLGCLLGFLQLVVAPKSSIYSSVFEVSSTVCLSFIGRAIGTIGGGKYFCFAAIVQGGMCMILPGYIILSGALEIQSRSLVAGSMRMFYAIIYSLFLGFGLTLGSALYGWMDHRATTNTTCTSNISPWWNFVFVPMFSLALSMASQAQWHQLSVMTIIACGGYVVSYFSSRHFSITEFNSALGSFTIGLLSNLYSRTGTSFRRIGYCNSAFTSMLTGIFDQVPGGVASRNVLAAGISQLSNQTNGGSGTITSAAAAISTSTLSFGISMIEIAIGISVGLFFSTMLVYPFGKKNTGIFSL
ncbi:hypothetical protein KL920_001418 [Ogataea angusta]|nr:hypothetical protein KL920_001418 [Ogataea angusta]